MTTIEAIGVLTFLKLELGKTKGYDIVVDAIDKAIQALTREAFSKLWED